MAALVREHMGGRPYRMAKDGRVRIGIGKLSFSDEKLEENAAAALAAIETHRLTPQGRFITSVSVSSTQAHSSYPMHYERQT